MQVVLSFNLVNLMLFLVGFIVIVDSTRGSKEKPIGELEEKCIYMMIITSYIIAIPNIIAFIIASVGGR